MMALYGTRGFTYGQVSDARRQLEIDIDTTLPGARRAVRVCVDTPARAVGLLTGHRR